MTKRENLLKGMWNENPVLVSLLGLCSVLAVTGSLKDSIGLGLAFTFVIVLSNIIISLIRKIVPHEIRIPIYIVVVATLVTLAEMLMNAFLPELYNNLGVWISLIVVNCIILGRAEAFASQNNVGNSFLDAVGMAVGYSGVLIVMAIIREFLGTGSISIWSGVELQIFDSSAKFFNNFFLNPPSAFIILGIIIGLANIINNKRKEVKK
ncbi:MAG: electron transport complex subunit RsxE [Bacilli bacterium]